MNMKLTQEEHRAVRAGILKMSLYLFVSCIAALFVIIGVTDKWTDAFVMVVAVGLACSVFTILGCLIDASFDI